MKHEAISPEDQYYQNVTSALIVALSVCYCARLQDREVFENSIATKFVDPLVLPGGVDQFREEIIRLVDETMTC